MLGSIEELEKEIEQFQNNMMASGELVTLLKQMIEEIKWQNNSFDQNAKVLISKVDNLPTVIETANDTNNSRIKSDVAEELGQAAQRFSDEQNKYIQDLEQTRQQIQEYIDLSNSQGETFDKKASDLLEKLDQTMNHIREENTRINDELKSAIDKLLADRNAEFAIEQEKYISSLQQTQNEIKTAEESLKENYNEFINTLRKINISNLYEQNQQLKNELRKKTTLLTILSVTCLVVGILGIFI